ncbi:hypothetical protein TNCV_3380881 [Trichonephila clavipes]|nr:hypothetical protein TNCV_3380881 [Trichonephila clavipes]
MKQCSMSLKLFGMLPMQPFPEHPIILKAVQTMNGTLPANKPKRNKGGVGYFQEVPTTDNLIRSKTCEALARRIRRQCQRESWISMLSQSHRQLPVNSYGEGQSSEWPLSGFLTFRYWKLLLLHFVPPLDGANLIGKTFCWCRQPLPYNCDFDMLKRALSSAQNTSPGLDGISYVLRHLSVDSLRPSLPTFIKKFLNLRTLELHYTWTIYRSVVKVRTYACVGAAVANCQVNFFDKNGATPTVIVFLRAKVAACTFAANGIFIQTPIRIRDIQIPVVPDVRFLSNFSTAGSLSFSRIFLQLRKRCEKVSKPAEGVVQHLMGERIEHHYFSGLSNRSLASTSDVLHTGRRATLL